MSDTLEQRIRRALPWMDSDMHDNVVEVMRDELLKAAETARGCWNDHCPSGPKCEICESARFIENEIKRQAQ